MFLFETHLHTRESSSCGQATAAEQAARYRFGGYDGVIVTDHFQPKAVDRISGKCESWAERIARQRRGFETLKQFETSDFTVLCGMEIRFKGFDNDYLVYGADPDFFLAHPDLTESSIEEFSKLARANGFALFQAHPMRDDMTIVDPALLDGVEVYNGNSSHNSRNAVADLWAKTNFLRRLSGTDSHSPWLASPGGVWLPRRPKDEKDFAQMLLNNEYQLKVKGAVENAVSD
ncbi:MAG: PHP domain-containing protein [Clostridia bacterium]|nr:PHP domain-containing protein [Clostridia bacterium]